MLGGKWPVDLCPIFVVQGSMDVSVGPIHKDKLGVLTKEEFEESLKQNGFEESDLDTERKRFISSSRDLSGYP